LWFKSRRVDPAMGEPDEIRSKRVKSLAEITSTEERDIEDETWQFIS
jgi:hypothetical protein